jgi:predicted DNA-binding transcriptional regulator AlpA
VEVKAMAVVREDDLVDASEGVRLTGLSKATLYKLSRTRRIRSFKVLSALRFRRGDLLALVREKSPESAETPRLSLDGRRP